MVLFSKLSSSSSSAGEDSLEPEYDEYLADITSSMASIGTSTEGDKMTGPTSFVKLLMRMSFGNHLRLLPLKICPAMDELSNLTKAFQGDEKPNLEDSDLKAFFSIAKAQQAIDTFVPEMEDQDAPSHHIPSDEIDAEANLSHDYLFDLASKVLYATELCDEELLQIVGDKEVYRVHWHDSYRRAKVVEEIGRFRQGVNSFGFRQEFLQELRDHRWYKDILEDIHSIVDSGQRLSKDDLNHMKALNKIEAAYRKWAPHYGFWVRFEDELKLVVNRLIREEAEGLPEDLTLAKPTMPIEKNIDMPSEDPVVLDLRELKEEWDNSKNSGPQKWFRTQEELRTGSAARQETTFEELRGWIQLKTYGRWFYSQESLGKAPSTVSYSSFSEDSVRPTLSRFHPNFNIGNSVLGDAGTSEIRHALQDLNFESFELGGMKIKNLGRSLENRNIESSIGVALTGVTEDDRERDTGYTSESSSEEAVGSSRVDNTLPGSMREGPRREDPDQAMKRLIRQEEEYSKVRLNIVEEIHQAAIQSHSKRYGQRLPKSVRVFLEELKNPQRYQKLLKPIHDIVYEYDKNFDASKPEHREIIENIEAQYKTWWKEIQDYRNFMERLENLAARFTEYSQNNQGDMATLESLNQESSTMKKEWKKARDEEKGPYALVMTRRKQRNGSEKAISMTYSDALAQVYPRNEMGASDNLANLEI